jgi:signal transduction histidine kinase/CheY-like chemotaxis protein
LTLPRWLLPPHYETPEEALRARVAHWVLVTAIVTLSLLLVTLPAYERDPYTLPVFGASLLAVLAAFVILHRGHLRGAALLACSISWLIVMVVSIASGGVRSPQLATTVLVVMLIGFLWSSRAAIVAAMLTSASILVLLLAAERDLLPRSGPNPAAPAEWGAITSVLAIAAVFLHFALRALDESRRALVDKSRELEREMERRSAAEESLRRAQKLEALGRLTGGIAHDFNNLLTVLLAQSAMLAERAYLGERLGDEAASEIRDIRISSERAAALTRRLLGFARPPSGPPEDVDPARALARLAPVLRRVIPENIRLEIEPPGRALAVRIDPGQFDQVILNLVLNARDAMPDGGVLQIEASEIARLPERAVAGSGSGAGPFLRVAVSDTGPGISREDRERVFDPFFTTKLLGHGTGLGLSTVHGIVTRAGGFVAIESEQGEGATLAVYLASGGARAAVEEPALEPRLPRTASRPATILVCEDEAPVRRILEATLGNAGYRVLSAPLPERALALARTGESIDLLVSDVVMPEMGGPELAEAVRRERGKLPVLLVTGYATADIEVGEEGGGATELLEKPFTVDRLLERVESLLERATGSRGAGPRG